MQNLKAIGTQIGLVIFAQALALATTTPAVSHTTQLAKTAGLATYSEEGSVVLAVQMDRPIEVSGTVVNGKATDRLLPANVFSVSGQQVARASKDEQRGKPPKEAFDACHSKSENESCDIKTRNGGNEDGVCRSGPQGGAKACVPKNRKTPPQRG